MDGLAAQTGGLQFKSQHTGKKPGVVSGVSNPSVVREETGEPLGRTCQQAALIASVRDFVLSLNQVSDKERHLVASSVLFVYVHPGTQVPHTHHTYAPHLGHGDTPPPYTHIPQ